MQEDNVLPNSGNYFGIPVEPPEQAVARKKERAKILEAQTAIKEVIDHFDLRIDYLDRLDSITEDITTDPILHQKVFHVNKLLKQALIEEKTLLEDLLETHIPNR